QQSPDSLKHGRPHKAERRWRIPATEIEDAVIDRLIKKLSDQQWVVKNCTLRTDTIARRRIVLAKAKELAGRIRSESRGALREILLTLLSRITLGEAEMRIDVQRTGLVAALGSVARTQAMATIQDMRLGNYTKTVEPRELGVADALSISVPMK